METGNHAQGAVDASTIQGYWLLGGLVMLGIIVARQRRNATA